MTEKDYYLKLFEDAEKAYYDERKDRLQEKEKTKKVRNNLMNEIDSLRNFLISKNLMEEYEKWKN